MCVSNLLIWSITWHHLTTWAKKGEEGSWTKSISSRAQHVTLQKYFSRQSLVICFFPTPPTKLKLGLGTTNRQKTTNSSPPGPIKLCNQSTAVVRLCCAFYQPQQTLQKYWAQNHFDETNRHFRLFFIQFWFAASHTEHRWNCSNARILDFTHKGENYSSEWDYD